MPSVMIIDDDAEVGASLKRVLEIAGFEVRVSLTAEQGMEEFRRQPSDVIITDIIMPKMDGIATITAIRKEFSAVPVVAISGGGNFAAAGFKPTAISTAAYLASAAKAGATATLAKPFDSRELLTVINRALGTGH
jgi:two-component system, chemotaxis family, chemotaxis protein CheY